jgi:hypothetical protein
MNFPLGKLLAALTFGFGAIAAPAALILLEAADMPRPEMHDPTYARALLAQGRLAWKDQQIASGSSVLRGDQALEPGSGD